MGDIFKIWRLGRLSLTTQKVCTMKEKTAKFTYIKIYICIVNDTVNKVKSLPQTGS